MNNRSLIQNKNVKLDFNTMSVRSLILKVEDGVNFNPEYQRGYEWDLDDKVSLIESIFLGADIGKFIFIVYSDKECDETGFSYEILDGKQRLNAITSYYKNEFTYEGLYYKDLIESDKLYFKNYSVSIAEANNLTKLDIYKYFLLANRSGKRISEEHLKMVENEYHNMLINLK